MLPTYDLCKNIINASPNDNDGMRHINTLATVKQHQNERLEHRSCMSQTQIKANEIGQLSDASVWLTALPLKMRDSTLPNASSMMRSTFGMVDLQIVFQLSVSVVLVLT